LQEWAHLGDLSAEVVRQYDEGAIDERGVEDRMCDAVMYFVSARGGGLKKHNDNHPKRLALLLGC
jgi:hypothetical protein